LHSIANPYTPNFYLSKIGFASSAGILILIIGLTVANATNLKHTLILYTNEWG